MTIVNPLPELSVVIPTFRQQELELALRALAEQTVEAARFEVLVVENGERSDAEQIVAEAGEKLRVSYHFLAEAGANRARNFGVSQARAPLIGMLDDDCLVSPDWVESVLRAAAQLSREANGIYIAGGRVELNFRCEHPPWLQGRFLGVLSRVNWDHRLTEEDRARGWVPLTEPEDYLVTGNMFFRREVWELLGGLDPGKGFCPRDSYVHSDELRMIRLLRERNERGLIYLPHLTVRHVIREWRTRLSYFMRRFYGQGVAEMSIQRERHPGWGEKELYRFYVANQENPLLYLPEKLWAKSCISDPADQQQFEEYFERCLAQRIEGMLDELRGNTEKIRETLYCYSSE